MIVDKNGDPVTTEPSTVQVADHLKLIKEEENDGEVTLILEVGHNEWQFNESEAKDLLQGLTTAIRLFFDENTRNQA